MSQPQTPRGPSTFRWVGGGRAIGAPAGQAPASARSCVDRLADQARDVHLREAEALADLRLREVLAGSAGAGSSRSRSARRRSSRSTVDGVLGAAEAASSTPSRRRACRPRRRRRRRGGRARAAWCARGGHAGLEHLLDGRAERARRAPRRSAGAPELAVELVRGALDAAACSSCRSRGTRTDQLLSRKWRLSSPTIVGMANEEKAMPRSASKRSIAFSSPSEATWTRSSAGSPPRP